MEVNEEIHEGSPTPQRLKNIRAMNSGVCVCVCVLHIVYVSTGGNKCIQHICGSGGFIKLERGVQPLVQRARVATPTSGT